MSPNGKSKVLSPSVSVSRTNSAGAALRRGELTISEPIPIPRGGDGYGPQSLPMLPDAAIRQSNPQTFEDFENARANPRIPSYATAPVLASGSSKVSLNKPKDNGFRATIRRIFGTKKKRDTTGSMVMEDPKRREALSFITTADSAKEPPTRRGVSVPEVTRHSALGSHSPFAAFMTTDDDALADQRRESFRDSGIDTHRRRNTLPSVVMSQKEEQALKESLEASMVRPTSRAETLKSNPRRRSRSVEPLINRLKPIEWPRNRSDEIKYWRTSVLESPIPSFKPHDSDTPEEATAVHERQPSGDTTSPIEPVQTFDFGLNNPTGLKNDSSDQRLNTLEVKLVDLEFAIAKLQQASEAEKPRALERPPHHRSQRQDSTATDSSASGIASPEPTFLSSPRPGAQYSQDTGEQSPPLEHRIHRSSAATTLRPSTAVRRSVERAETPPPPPTSAYATMEHIQNLLALVQREQASRHRLELQVKNLSSQLEQFQRSPPYTYFKTDFPYPTPSPEDSSRSTRQNPMVNERRVMNPPPRFRDDISVSTDDDDGYLDVYETPAEEDQEHEFNNNSLGNMRSPQMVGMI